jgi:hypothetical protein
MSKEEVVKCRRMGEGMRLFGSSICRCAGIFNLVPVLIFPMAIFNSSTIGVVVVVLYASLGLLFSSARKGMEGKNVEGS